MRLKGSHGKIILKIYQYQILCRSVEYLRQRNVWAKTATQPHVTKRFDVALSFKIFIREINGLNVGWFFEDHK